MAKLSGGLNNWYVVAVKNPQRKEQEPYQAECEDIIQALGMTFDEGCAFKALWRNAAARMGNGKPGNTAVYDAEKLVHYANRILSKERIAAIVAPLLTEDNSLEKGWYYVEDVQLLIDISKKMPNRRVETISNTGAKTSGPMQAVHWGSIRQYRYVEALHEDN